MFQFFTQSFKACLVLTFVTGLLWGCASIPNQRATLKQNYDRTAQYHKPDRNPIIVIPGILGSRLVDDDSGQTVWGAFRAQYADPETDEGARLIALPLIDTLRDNIGRVRPDGVLETLELDLGGFPINIQAYAGILTTLGAGGYQDDSLGLNSIDYGTDHFTCFQFDYDWRRDITYNAHQLKVFIDEKRAEVQQQYEKHYGIKNAEVKFDIAAHSMGGILTRYFLRYGDAPLPEEGQLPSITWAGAEDVERAILVAPPNAGSLDAFDQLINGFNTGRPLLPFYDRVILGTFPSVYQLLPRSRHQALLWDGNPKTPIDDILDPDLWKHYEWGLSTRNADSLRILRSLLPETKIEDDIWAQAAAFQAKALNNARRFHAAIDRPASPPPGLELYLVTGDASKTPQTLTVDRSTGHVSLLEEGVGDTVVLRSSALMDERVGSEWKPTLQTPIDWTSVLFLPAEHRTITSNPVFEDNVLYWLLEAPRSHLRQE